MSTEQPTVAPPQQLPRVALPDRIMIVREAVPGFRPGVAVYQLTDEVPPSVYDMKPNGRSIVWDIV